ncbi:MAG: AMP-binding enzyme, partial [Ilumatobacteraceae bacterium]
MHAELVARRVEGLALGAVYGVPDPSGQFGELVKAVVQLRPGCSLDKRGLVAHCAESLARYKLPALVDFVTSIPLTGSGKVAKAQIKAADAAAREVAQPARTERRAHDPAARRDFARRLEVEQFD